jgi:hypothetical protein
MLQTKPVFRFHAIAIAPPPTSINIKSSIIKHPRKMPYSFALNNKSTTYRRHFCDSIPLTHTNKIY